MADPLVGDGCEREVEVQKIYRTVKCRLAACVGIWKLEIHAASPWPGAGRLVGKRLITSHDLPPILKQYHWLDTVT